MVGAVPGTWLVLTKYLGNEWYGCFVEGICSRSGFWEFSRPFTLVRLSSCCLYFWILLLPPASLNWGCCCCSAGLGLGFTLCTASTDRPTALGQGLFCFHAWHRPPWHCTPIWSAPGCLYARRESIHWFSDALGSTLVFQQASELADVSTTSLKLGSSPFHLDSTLSGIVSAVIEVNRVVFKNQGPTPNLATLTPHPFHS